MNSAIRHIFSSRKVEKSQAFVLLKGRAVLSNLHVKLFPKLKLECFSYVTLNLHLESIVKIFKSK